MGINRINANACENGDLFVFGINVAVRHRLLHRIILHTLFTYNNLLFASNKMVVGGLYDRKFIHSVFPKMAFL